MAKAGYVLTFVGGAAAGGFTAWQLLKNYYEEKTRKEIESVKEAFGREPKQPEVKDIQMKLDLSKECFETVTQIVAQNGYVPEVPEIPKHDGPYVISPDDFGEFYEYSKVYLTYFNDGVLSDNEYDMLTTTEIEQSCGYECLDHFGDYEEDTVYVRNDSKRCDYEITKDLRNYTELSPAYS